MTTNESDLYEALGPDNFDHLDRITTAMESVVRSVTDRCESCGAVWDPAEPGLVVREHAPSCPQNVPADVRTVAETLDDLGEDPAAWTEE